MSRANEDNATLTNITEPMRQFCSFTLFQLFVVYVCNSQIEQSMREEEECIWCVGCFSWIALCMQELIFHWKLLILSRIIGMCCRNATIPAMNAAAEFFPQSASAYFVGVSFKWPFAVWCHLIKITLPSLFISIFPHFFPLRIYWIPHKSQSNFDDCCWCSVFVNEILACWKLLNKCVWLIT